MLLQAPAAGQLKPSSILFPNLVPTNNNTSERITYLHDLSQPSPLRLFESLQTSTPSALLCLHQATL